MVTNDERREVAKKLRELPSDVYEVESQWKTEGISTDCHDQTDYYLIHDVLLECLPAEHMHPFDYEELHARLAELIEPEPERTCRMIDNGAEFCCSECDWRHDYDDEPWFCAGCGAKVIQYEDYQ